MNDVCCADFGGGVDSQGQGYEHALPKFAGAWMSTTSVSAAP